MEKNVLDILGAIEPRLWWLLIQVMLAFGIGLFLKAKIESYVAYYLFKINNRLAIGVRVHIRGHDGIITSFNKRWIFVRTAKGEIIVPIQQWQSEQWMLPDITNHIKEAS